MSSESTICTCLYHKTMVSGCCLEQALTKPRYCCRQMQASNYTCSNLIDGANTGEDDIVYLLGSGRATGQRAQQGTLMGQVYLSEGGRMWGRRQWYCSVCIYSIPWLGKKEVSPPIAPDSPEPPCLNRHVQYITYIIFVTIWSHGATHIHINAGRIHQTFKGQIVLGESRQSSSSSN